MYVVMIRDGLSEEMSLNVKDEKMAVIRRPAHKSSSGRGINRGKCLGGESIWCTTGTK